jgi:hypothetical protein
MGESLHEAINLSPESPWGRFVSGHDFSRAVAALKENGFSR